MSDTASRRRAYSGEARTLVVLVCCIVGFFVWLDFREERHDEISTSQCAELNRLWQDRYRGQFDMSGRLDVAAFECPSVVSGLARGLQFLEANASSSPLTPVRVDFLKMLVDTRLKLGASPGSRFAGFATYGDHRIDINPDILLRGDPVEIAAVLVHEARHLQQGFDTHVQCRKRRRSMCDATFDENPANAGAYSYNVYFYHSVLKKPDMTWQHKRTATRLLKQTLDARFNDIRSDLREKFAP